MELTGKKFGRWTVLRYSHSVSRNKYWLCKCECGTIKPVYQGNLVNNRTKSCGCYLDELPSIGERSLKHGDFGTKLYGIWNGIKTRCYNKNHKYYADYGGRGIKVCDEWKDYIGFKQWAIPAGYHEGLSIERIDVDGDYCPENCKWIPLSEQNRNKRNTIHIEYEGKLYTMKEIAKITGLKERTIKGRYERGWSPEKIFNTPLKKNQY